MGIDVSFEDFDKLSLDFLLKKLNGHLGLAMENSEKHLDSDSDDEDIYDPANPSIPGKKKLKSKSKTFVDPTDPKNKLAIGKEPSSNPLDPKKQPTDTLKTPTGTKNSRKSSKHGGLGTIKSKREGHNSDTDSIGSAESMNSI